MTEREAKMKTARIFFIYCFVVVLTAWFTLFAKAVDPIVVTNKMPAGITVTNKIPAKVKTLCACAETLTCTCWESQCSCPRCGLGGAATQPGKPRSSTDQGTQATHARSAESNLQPILGRGSFGAIAPAAGTTTAAPILNVGRFGGTSRNCPTGTT